MRHVSAVAIAAGLASLSTLYTPRSLPRRAGGRGHECGRATQGSRTHTHTHTQMEAQAHARAGASLSTG
jgi:hypothetical protein